MNLIKLLLGISFVFLLGSCHSMYLNGGFRTDGTIVWNEDRSAFAFVAKTSLYRRPVGIATFPDGGMVKNEYMDFSLYYFDIKQKKLSHLINLNEFYLGSAYRWLSIKQVALDLQDSFLFYKLIEPYDYNIQYIKEDRITGFLEDISKTYRINIFTQEKDVVDATAYKHLFDNKREKLEPSSAKNYFSNLSFSDWGIKIKELYPQSKNTYMKYIIEKEGDILIRNDILKQIVPEFTRRDKEYILKKMKERAQNLYNDFKKTNEIKDPYRRSLKQDKYEDYLEYMDEIKKQLNITN